MTLITHNPESLITKSTQKLLQTLELEPTNLVRAPDNLHNGLLMMLCNEEAYLKAWKDCLNQAGDIAIFIDEESFVAAQMALQKLDCKCQLLCLAAYLLQHQAALESKLVANRFDGFCASYCSSAFGAFYPKNHDFALLQILGLETQPNHYESVAHISAFNPQAALAENARVYYAMADSGADMAVCSAWSSFSFFEQQAKKMQASMNRGTLELPILHISEVALIALGQSIAAHKIPLGML